MTDTDRVRLVVMKRTAKIGHSLTRAEQQFVERMFNEYPVEFRQIDKEVNAWAQLYVLGQAAIDD
jgi:hypothetical protein